MAAAPKTRVNPGQNRPPAAPVAALPARKVAEPKTQLGARVSETTHRQLKLAAVLRGVTVQTLVEQAIQEFLTNHPELFQSSPAPSPPPVKSPRRKSR
jgi:hypothetical protein